MPRVKARECNPQMAQIYADARDPETYEIIGAAMEVHRYLGPGFLEQVYHEALAKELRDRRIPYVREQELPVYYKGEKLNCSYRADLVCYGAVIVELKAMKALTGIGEAQLLNYLKATGLKRGLLLNFGSPRLEFKRFVYSHPGKSEQPAEDNPSLDP
jgi:GxxExxY protein